MTDLRRALIVVAVLLGAMFGLPGVGVVREAAAQIAVTAADPPTGEQGTLNLSVKITGKGFKSGAKAKFLKTGTTDTGGVNVKSTQFVSSTQLLVLVDIADAAALSLFDIQVQNTDGRTGKGTELFSVVQKGSWAKQDVELAVTFTDTGSPGWYGDALGAYQSDSGNLAAKIQFVDYDENGIGGRFFLDIGSNSGRSLTFDFGAALPYDPSAVCPERCPGPPDEALPDFSAEPIQKVTIYTVFGYSPPNYDFLNPAVCDYNADGTSDWAYDATGTPYCVTDALVFINTAQNIYRLRMSPNVWRTYAPNTMPYGIMKVRYFAELDQWTLERLLGFDVGGTGQQEPCPAVLERRAQVKGRVSYKFLGCFDMPFDITLTKR